MNEALVCIGSNDDGERNLNLCRQLLIKEFNDIIFSETCFTSPIGKNYKGDFINQLAVIRSDNSKECIFAFLKLIEKELGRNRTDKFQGLVKIDADLVIWNNEILKKEDINRNYVQNLLPSLPLDRYKRLTIT